MKKSFKNLVSLFLALATVLALLPAAALNIGADGVDEEPGTEPYETLDGGVVANVEDPSVEVTADIYDPFASTQNNEPQPPQSDPEPAYEYDVWVGGTQVTSENKNDVLNDGGRVKYDPSTRTLTLNGPYLPIGEWDDAFTYHVCAVGDLTIEGSYNDGDADTTFCFKMMDGVLRLKGYFTLRGQLAAVEGDCGIILISGNMQFYGESYGLRVRSNGNADEIGVQVYGAATAYMEGYEPIYGNVTLYGRQSMITKPFDSTLEKWYSRIRPDTRISKSFNLWIGSTQVTTDNMDDVLGDGGSVRFVPDEDTLYLDGPSIADNYTFNDIKDPDDVLCKTAKIAVKGMPLTVKGTWVTLFASSDIAIYSDLNDLTIEGSSIMVRGRQWGVYCAHPEETVYTLTLRGDVYLYGADYAVYAPTMRTVIDGTAELRGGTDGIKSKYVTMNGSGLIRGNSAAAVESDGDVWVNGDFTLEGGEYGIIVKVGSLTVLGGSVTATGTGCAGIVCWGDADLSGGSVDTTGGKYGLYAVRKLIVRNDFKLLTAHGGEGYVAVRCSDYSHIKYALIKTPQNAVHYNNAIRECVQLDGTYVMLIPATEVVIYRAYYLLVENTLVTALNADDILGDGTVSYDPLTHTLTLNEPVFDEVFTGEGYTAAICSAWTDLTVTGTCNSSSAIADYAVLCRYGTLTLDGDLSFYGNEDGVYADHGVKLRGNIYVQGASYGVYSNGPITVWDGSTVARLVGGVASARMNGGLRLNDDLIVKSPLKANADGGYYITLKNSSTVVKDATIAQRVRYPLWLGSEQVTEENADDIFGDGRASYDPENHALILNDPVIPYYCRCTSGYRYSVKIYFNDPDASALSLYGSYHMVSSDLHDYGIYSECTPIVSYGTFSFYGYNAGIYCGTDVYLMRGSLYSYGENKGGLHCLGKAYIWNYCNDLVFELGNDAYDNYGALKAEGGVELTCVEGSASYIAEPQGGHWDSESKCVVDSSGQIARRVSIKNETIWIDGLPYRKYTPNMTMLMSDNYAITEDVTFNGRLPVYGTVRLAILDGATMTVTGGFNTIEGYTLSVKVGTVASLNEGRYLPEGGIVITSPAGTVAAIGGAEGYGGGNFEMYGGSLTIACGADGAGIGGGKNSGTNGTVKLVDCSVTIVSQNGEAIGAGSGGQAEIAPDIGDLAVYVNGGRMLYADRQAMLNSTGSTVEIRPCTDHVWSPYRCKYCNLLAGFPDFLEGEGSESSPYIIGSAGNWNSLAGLVAAGVDSDGKYFEQTADFTITRFVGDSSASFHGIYDGAGHTLYASLSANVTGVAPFSYINGAKLRNLIVDGSVTGKRHSAGLVGFAGGGSNEIYNCRINVSVTTTDSYCGGILGHGGTAMTTIEGCVFAGAISGASHAGTLWGWSDNGSFATIVNCYDASDTSWPIGAGRPDPGFGQISTVYRAKEKIADPSRPWSMIGAETYLLEEGEYVTIDPGESIDYDVSGLSFYANVFSCDGVLMFGGYVTLPAALSADLPEGRKADTFLANLSVLTPNYYLPDENVTVNAVWGSPYADYTDCSCAYGEEGAGVDKLFDGSVGTAWRVSDMTGEVSVTFRTNDEVCPTGYLLVTGPGAGNDASRNPVSWTLEGSADGEHWTTISDVSNDCTLGAFSSKTYAFYPDIRVAGRYSYFRFTVKELGGGSTLELSELRLITRSFADADLDRNGTVSISDVTALLDHLSTASAYDATFDLNADKAVSITDATCLLDDLSTAC